MLDTFSPAHTPIARCFAKLWRGALNVQARCDQFVSARTTRGTTVRRKDSVRKKEQEAGQRRTEAGQQRSEPMAVEPWKPIDFEGPDESLTQAELALLK